MQRRRINPSEPVVVPTRLRWSDRTIALLIALAIALCLTLGVWIFITLEPYMSDFVSSSSPVATETVEPAPVAP